MVSTGLHLGPCQSPPGPAGPLAARGPGTRLERAVQGGRIREFETTFIVQPEISDEGVGALCTRLDGVLAKHEAVRLLCDDSGRRRLAYEIGNFQKGRYLTLLYLDNGSVVAELERALRLDDSVLRFLTVQVQREVSDVEGRKAEAVELERVRAQKAAERAARDAEEAARAAEAEARAEAEGMTEEDEEGDEVDEDMGEALEDGADEED